MDLLSNYIAIIIASVVVISALILRYLHQISTYWQRRGIKSIGNLFSGCFKETINAKKSLSDVLEELYRQTKTEKFFGTFMFGEPILVVNDAHIIKQILVTEFPAFNSHGIYVDKINDPLSGNVFNLEGEDWKTMRAKLSPIFTSGKIKYMFHTMLDCVMKLDKVIDSEKETVIDTLNVMASLSIDVIASVAFGIEANCLEDPKSEFGIIGRKVNEPTFSQFLRLMALTNMHSLAKILRVKIVTKEINKFFTNLVKDTVEYRETNNITRNDFLDLMIRLKNSGEIEGSLNAHGQSAKTVTMGEIAAQAFIFFIAGFETTSQANTFTLLEMAKNHKIQRRVQAECDKVLSGSNGQITYEALNGLEYTEQVIRETMRLYPGLQILIRSTMKKCKLPLTDVELDKGTTIWIPLAALHKDPDSFPEPDKFDPKRFSNENKSSIPPTMYMPFGDGPRTCIGMRFALVQVKALMLHLLSKFDVDVVEDTTLTVKLDPKCHFPRPMGKFRLKFTPRNKSL